jgi:hypothetical protein
MDMKIQVWLWGHLTQYVSDKNAGKLRVVEVGEETTIKRILNQLGIPDWAADLIFLNGVQALESEIPKDGDRLAVFPRLLAGG